jgi:capsular exopolysaccharide synthesis family protein
MAEFRTYIAPALRWWWLILLATLIAGGTAYYFGDQLPPVYESRTTLVVGRTISETNPDPNQFSVQDQLVRGYITLATSQVVVQNSASALSITDEEFPEYEVVYIGSGLFQIRVTDTNPERAQVVAETLAAEVIRQSPGGGEDQAAIERRAFIEGQLADLQRNINETDAEISRLQESLSGAISAVEQEQTRLQIANLNETKRTLQDSYSQLLQSLDARPINQVEVFEPANLPNPNFPVGPNLLLIVAAAVLGGGLLSTAAAYLIEFLDDTLKSADDVARATGQPIVGHIVELDKGKGGVLLSVADKPRSPAAEAFRSLRTNLEFTAVDKPLRTILLTSAAAGDGKTTVAYNLALSLAQSGKRVALIDADLRKPSLHTVLGMTNQEGLSDLFRKPLHVSDVLRQYKGDRVLVMTSGDLPPNPTELLGSRRMDQIMGALRELADVVIVDGPPFFIADAWVLASRVDGLLWVARPGFTRRGALRSLIAQARRTGTFLVGIVLNRLAKGQGSYATRYSYLSHYYGQDQAQKQIEAPAVEPSQRLLQPMLREKREAAIASPEVEAEKPYTNGHRVEVLPAIPPEAPTTERGKVSLDLLYALSYELASQLDLNELMQRILKMTLESVGATSGSMIAVDPKGEPIEGVMIYDGRTYASDPQQLKDIVQKGLARWVIENRRPVVLNNTAEDPRWLNRSWDENPQEPRSAISVPLMAEDRVVGVLTLVHPKANHFTRDDLSLLTAIAVGISFNSGAYAGQTR